MIMSDIMTKEQILLEIIRAQDAAIAAYGLGNTIEAQKHAEAVKVLKRVAGVA